MNGTGAYNQATDTAASLQALGLQDGDDRRRVAGRAGGRDGRLLLVQVAGRAGGGPGGGQLHVGCRDHGRRRLAGQPGLAGHRGDGHRLQRQPAGAPATSTDLGGRRPVDGSGGSSTTTTTTTTGLVGEHRQQRRLRAHRRPRSSRWPRGIPARARRAAARVPERVGSGRDCSLRRRFRRRWCRAPARSWPGDRSEAR